MSTLVEKDDKDKLIHDKSNNFKFYDIDEIKKKKKPK